jgi:hypothetical protein
LFQYRSRQNSLSFSSSAHSLVLRGTFHPTIDKETDEENDKNLRKHVSGTTEKGVKGAAYKQAEQQSHTGTVA